MKLKIDIPESSISINHCHPSCAFLTFKGPSHVIYSLFDYCLKPDLNLPSSISYSVEFFRCEKCHEVEEF